MKQSDTSREAGSDGKSDTANDKKEDDKPPSFANYWRILAFGSRTEHILLAIATLTAAGSGTALPLMNIVFGRFIGDFNGYVDTTGAAAQDELLSANSRNALFFVYLFIGKFVLTYIGMFCFRVAGLRISAALRLKYLRSLFAQPVRKLDQVSAGAVATTITTSANTIQTSVSERLSIMFQSMALVITAYAIAFTYSWALTLVTSSGILFIAITISATAPSTIKAMHRLQKSEEKHATVASEVLSSIRTVFALGAEPKMTAKHTRYVEESHKAGTGIAMWTATQMSPFFFTTYASYALAFWFGLKLYRDGNIGSVTNVIVVFFSVLIVTTVVGQIAHPLIYINQAIAASPNFFSMMDAQPVRVDGRKDPDVSAHEDITFENVTFAYPTRPGVRVLQNISATFAKGKTTALVGPSGSGKSTVVGLLERWYSLGDELAASQDDASTPKLTEKTDLAIVNDQEQEGDAVQIGGAIKVGGDNIDTFNLKWWRTQIGLVQQEPFLFHDTIQKNVEYGLVGTEWEDADEEIKAKLVKEACIEAFADEFVQKLPNAYRTMVGEGGIKLSGGQRQRIAIARSIVRKPAILILDEATSAIDVRGERIVQDALDRASKNRTTIMIAHRLSTIRKADKIIVLRLGQKLEEGTHDELLAKEDGLYHGLVRAQKIEEDATSDNVHDPDITLAELNTVLTHISTRKSGGEAAVQIPDALDEEKGLAPVTYRKKGFFRVIGQVISEQQSKAFIYVPVLIAAMVCGAAYALQAWFFAQLVQAFQYTGQRLVDAGNFWALMFFILSLVVTLAYAVLAFGSGLISINVGTYCRRDYFHSALRMPVAYYDQDENSSGSVMQRISGDPKQIQDLLGINSSFPVISIFNVLGSVIVSFYFGWKLTLVVFFTVTPVIIGASFLRMRYEVQFEANSAAVFSASSQFATEAVSAFRTVSSLAMESVVINKYDALLSDQVHTSTRKASYAMLVYALADSVELCGMALAFWYGGKLLAEREYQPFQFFVIFSAVVQGAQAAGQYLSITPNLAYATAAGNRILELRSRASDHTRSKEQPRTSSTELGATVQFKRVTFSYPGLSAPLFSKLDISIDAGQFVAFVGPSGCGKTSTISLLERFYDLGSGTIEVDDEDIATLDTRAYRSKVALVSQEPRLFSGTIRDNLLMGLEAATASEEKIVQACRDAEIHDFVTSLPDGYATELGRNTSLSGGQKQRLCLARALLRQPKLLLLDEATSSLDSQSEKLVQGAIERLAGQRSMTVIAVAHRLATIQKADVIFVFGETDTEARRGSRVVERGSHNELLAKRGVYWSMCQAQALDR